MKVNLPILPYLIGWVTTKIPNIKLIKLVRACLVYCVSGNSKQICFYLYYGPSKYILIFCKEKIGNIEYNPLFIYKYNIHYTEDNTSRQNKVNIHDYTEYRYITSN